MDYEYRIKEMVNGLGESNFILQCKTWFGWNDVRDCHYRTNLEESQRDYQNLLKLSLMRSTKEEKYHNVE
jgi:hypothetical protein